MFCSVKTKNSNWEILTKNLVTFKRKYEVKDEKRMYFWGSQKNQSFRGVHEKWVYIGGLPEKGGLGQFADLRWLSKKERVVLIRGLIPQCTLQGFPNNGKRQVKP